MPRGDDDRNMPVARRPKSKIVANPLQAGIMKFFDEQQPNITCEVTKVPKRYTRYGSLLLLGPTFATHSVEWSQTYTSLTDVQRTALFGYVVRAFGDGSLTHVAINAPIKMTRECISGEVSNEMRTPTGLDPVYGDFGPVGNSDLQHPSQADLEAAYWTSTAPLKGIVQVWAPRHSMYSRGNISEKSRILQDGTSKSSFPGLTNADLGEALESIDVVDFYVGIGYFALCYLSRGVKRVWGWDINEWSIEGLRRGCVANGWEVRVIRIDDDGLLMGDQTIEKLAAEIQALEGTATEVRCIAFCGNNKWAAQVLGEIRSAMSSSQRPNTLNIRHCNLGLLPSSQDSWEDAVRLINSNMGGWLHVHENVEASAINTKQNEFLFKIQEILSIHKQGQWSAACEHVEQVKTYAPGVIHCVYDIKIYPSS